MSNVQAECDHASCKKPMTYYDADGGWCDDHGPRAASIVAICGSMRMWPQMLEAAAGLARDGVVALLPVPCPDGDRDMLARLHERRIDMAESVLVVGEPGEDTVDEILYASVRYKPVHYTEERPDEPPVSWCDINGHKPVLTYGRTDGGPCAACGEWAPA